MRVAVIDDGVNTIFFRRKCLRLKVHNQKITTNDEEATTQLTHSTIILGIIDELQDHHNKHEYINIKIMEPDQLTTCLENLVIALTWCLENDIDLIHLSIGSTQYYDKYALKSILNEIENQGIIVVAALSNEYKISYPASLSGVIGVKYCDSLNEQEVLFHSEPLDGIELSTGCKQRIFDHEIIKCNSYAAATISGIILNTFNTLSTHTILSYFKKKSTNSYYVDECFKRGNIHDIPCVRYTCKYDSSTKNFITKLNESFFDCGYHSIVITPNCNIVSDDIFSISKNSGTILDQINELIYIASPDIVFIDQDVAADCYYVDFNIIIEHGGLKIFNMDFQHHYELPQTNTIDFIVNKILKYYSK